VAKWNPLALKILMWLMGVLLVVSSAASFIGVNVIPTNNGIAGAANAPVAGIAFGAGVMIAGFDPVANISWVRAVVVYAVLEVVYNVFTMIAIGAFDIVSLIIAIIVAAVILFLYPNKPALLMQSGGTPSGARA
jgi:hypothetical protein